MVGRSHGPPCLFGNRCTFGLPLSRGTSFFTSRSLPADWVSLPTVPPGNTTEGATMGSSPEYALLGDIGATNARLALLSKGLLGPIERFTVAEFARFTDLVDAFLERHCRHVSVPNLLTTPR